MDEKTSPEIAALASRVLSGELRPGNITGSELLSLAGSCLTQAADKGEVAGLPVAGYKATQPPEAIAVVNRFKALEERVLREIDNLTGPANADFADQRCIATGKTYLQTAFMWLARGIFQPGRVALPEDAEVGNFSGEPDPERA